jgi:hypothetical protein
MRKKSINKLVTDFQTFRNEIEAFVKELEDKDLASKSLSWGYD